MKIKFSKWLTAVIYAASGALLALPFLSDRLTLVAWLAGSVVFFLELADNRERHALRRAYLRGFAFFYCYGLVVFYWFIELYPLDFAGFSKGAALAVVLLAWLGIPLLQASISALMFVLLRPIVRVTRSKLLPLYPLAAASLYIIFEYVQTLTWAGVPWGRISMGQVPMLAAIQGASLFGSYFVSFIVILVNASVSLGVYYIISRKDRRGALISFISAILIFALNLTLGTVALHKSKLSEQSASTLTVAAIQGNLSSSEKWSDDAFERTFAIYERLTLDAANDGAELIVWPETALPYDILDSSYITARLSDLAKQADAVILVGGYYNDSEQNSYNSIFAVLPSGDFSPQIYQKRHLVPFGEYVPMRKLVTTLVPPLAEISMLANDITAGSEATVITVGDAACAPLICFDSIYEELTRASVLAGGNIIAISTNDSWFSDSRAIWQHNYHAVLRAVENGRSVIRAANTGVSSLILPSGETIELLEPLEEGYLIGELPLNEDITLYTRLGNVIVLAAALYSASLISISVFSRIKNKYNRKNSHIEVNV